MNAGAGTTVPRCLGAHRLVVSYIHGGQWPDLPPADVAASEWRPRAGLSYSAGRAAWLTIARSFQPRRWSHAAARDGHSWIGSSAGARQIVSVQAWTVTLAPNAGTCRSASFGRNAVMTIVPS